MFLSVFWDSGLFGASFDDHSDDTSCLKLGFVIASFFELQTSSTESPNLYVHPFTHAIVWKTVLFVESVYKANLTFLTVSKQANI